MTEFSPPHAAGAARPVAFIDLEASGLNAQSWPVEVGWAYAEGSPEAVLIRPDPSWLDAGWDVAAEALHGLKRDRLRRDGERASDVCDRLDAALTGRAVYSDAPDWDAFWIGRLYAAARRRAPFRIESMADLILPMIRGRERPVLDRAERASPRRHRAAADAAFLQTLYRCARAAAGEA